MKNKIRLVVTFIVVLMVIGLAVFLFVQKIGNDRNIDDNHINNIEQGGIVDKGSVDEKTDFYEIKVKYPVEPLDKDGVMKRFIDQEVALRKTQWSAGGEAYEEEKAVEAQFPDRPKMVFSYNLEYQVFRSEELGTVSYVLTIGEYTGGANGNESVKAFTFNEDGRIGLSSVFNIRTTGDGMDSESIKNLNTLSEKIYQKAVSDSERFPDAQIVKDGLGLNEALKVDPLSLAPLLSNFALTDQGPVFYFDKGAITMRASGVVSISLDWGELDSILMKEESQNLPDGYSLKNYTVAKVLDVVCEKKEDCETPFEYMAMSSCPYTTLCLDKKCTVVCPGQE